MTKLSRLKTSSFVSRLAWGYVILFTLWIVLRLLFFDRFWLLALINTVAIYLFVPLLILLPLVIYFRQGRALLGLGFPLGVFIAFYSPFFLTQVPTVASSNQQSFTAMSFNMLFSNTDFDAISLMVRNNAPDIIGIQEVPPKGDSVWIGRFSSDYPYHAFRTVEEGHNVGILSRFPIENIEMLPNPPLRRALKARVIVNKEKRLDVIVSHLTPNYPTNEALKLAREWYSRRANEVTYLRELIKKRRLPTIMLCDCNFTDTSETYARMHEVMRDSFREVGWGLGHTMQGQFFPIARLDYIWHTEELKPVNSHVDSGGGSDHFPIMSKLLFAS